MEALRLGLGVRASASVTPKDRWVATSVCMVHRVIRSPLCVRLTVLSGVRVPRIPALFP